MMNMKMIIIVYLWLFLYITPITAMEVISLPCGHSFTDTSDEKPLTTIKATQQCLQCCRHIRSRWLSTQSLLWEKTSDRLALLSRKYQGLTISTEDILDEIAYMWEFEKNYDYGKQLLLLIDSQTQPVKLTIAKILHKAHVPDNMDCISNHLLFISNIMIEIETICTETYSQLAMLLNTLNDRLTNVQKDQEWQIV